MSLPLEKLVNWQDVRKLYNDLRDRVKDKYTKPETGIPATDFAAGAVPVTDVQIDETSILNNGVANIPVATSSKLGAVKVDSTFGILLSNKKLTISKASDAYIKSGASLYKPIVPANQHTSAFYALAKLAGAEMDNSSNPVGTYTDAALQAIQKLFGLAGILGPYEDDLTADRAYAIGETFVMNGKRYRATAAIAQDGLITPGTNCVLDPLNGDFVKRTDIASDTVAGVVKVGDGGAGITLNAAGRLRTLAAYASHIKAGTDPYRPIVPEKQHESAFFGLSKAAGVDLANKTVTVGTYPQSSKTAIQTMLGISTGAVLIENVSGAAPSITALPNVRYVCGECSSLNLTPPALGSCEVIFSSGTTPTLLTVPNTVKFPAWFDATALEASIIYDIIITDGVYGAVMTWAS